MYWITHISIVLVFWRADYSFSPFDYELKYTIFDHELELSPEATITLENTAKNTNYEASGGGGGSLGFWGVLGLLGLAFYRQRPRKS